MDIVKHKEEVLQNRVAVVEQQRAALEFSRQNTEAAMANYRASIGNVVACYEEQIRRQKALTTVGVLAIIALGALITIFINPAICLAFIVTSLLLFLIIKACWPTAARRRCT